MLLTDARNLHHHHSAQLRFSERVDERPGVCRRWRRSAVSTTAHGYLLLAESRDVQHDRAGAVHLAQRMDERADLRGGWRRSAVPPAAAGIMLHDRRRVHHWPSGCVRIAEYLDERRDRLHAKHLPDRRLLRRDGEHLLAHPPAVVHGQQPVGLDDHHLLAQHLPAAGVWLLLHGVVRSVCDQRAVPVLRAGNHVDAGADDLLAQSLSSAPEWHVL